MSPLESNDPNRENQQAGEPPQLATDSPANADGRDRWGMLPTHTQDTFRSAGGTDLPPQYRDWIDAYHRRLQKSER